MVLHANDRPICLGSIRKRYMHGK